jgi:Fe-S cluster assembly protein SufD
MSNDAVMYTKPQLEIFADDVKCSHGATTGQMDEAALFYLRARGINKPDAQSMLNKAFASDVMTHVLNDGLRNYCDSLLEGKI